MLNRKNQKKSIVMQINKIHFCAYMIACFIIATNSFAMQNKLLEAVKANNSVAVQDSIMYGAAVNAVNENSDAPLHIACRLGNLSIVRILLIARADIEKKAHDSLTPLHIAAWYNHLEVVKELVRCRANLNATHVYGATPLDMAERAGNKGVIQYLKRHYARNGSGNCSYCHSCGPFEKCFCYRMTCYQHRVDLYGDQRCTQCDEIQHCDA